MWRGRSAWPVRSPSFVFVVRRGDPKDIAYVFFTLGVGLACGMGYIGYAVLFAMILCAAMAILQIVHFGQPKTARMTLKITVPENLKFPRPV